MLPPDKVAPFLQHADKAVREHAVDYFAKAGDPSPVTADDFWRAIDHVGLDDSVRFLSRLNELPQPDYACTRALETLRSGPAEEVAYRLQRAIQRVDFDVLAARREELLGCDQLLPHVRDHLSQRLALAEVPADELWQRLLSESRRGDDKAYGAFDERVADRLIEALARHGTPAAEWALARLRDDPAEDWMEIYCVDLLGQLRYAPAVEVLVNRLLPDTDLLRERVVAALGRIGTTEVIERIEVLYPTAEWHVRLYAHDPLARVKRPESEAALLRLLPTEKKPDLIANLAGGLCELCTTEGLEAVRRVIVDRRFDPQMLDLDEMFLAVCTMVGYEPPEAAQWREKVARREADRARRLAKMGGEKGLLKIFPEILERFRKGEPPWPKSEGADEFDEDEEVPAGPAALWSAEDLLPGAGATTFQREAPKVGRNDPCPCGSGKKYKKCCLRGADVG